MERKTRALQSLVGAGLALGMLSGTFAASISSGGTAGNGVTWASAGGTSTYTVTYGVDSSGPLAAETWQLQVPLPAQTSDATWECVAATGAASCPATSSGSGAIDSTIAVGEGATSSSVTFRFTVAIDRAASGSILFDALIGTNGSTPTSFATDSDVIATGTVDDGVATVEPGGTTTYAITYGYTKMDTVGSLPNWTMKAPLPSAVTDATWTCTATGDLSCSPSGTGAIDDPLVLNYDTGSGTVTYLLTTSISSTATGTLDLSAFIADDPANPAVQSLIATDSDTIAVPPVPTPPEPEAVPEPEPEPVPPTTAPTPVPTPVPTLHTWALMLLASALALLGGRRMRKR